MNFRKEEKIYFDPPIDTDIKFANGGYYIQRDSAWLRYFRKYVYTTVKNHNPGIDYTPETYGWYRCLDDSNSPYYNLALRLTYICPICYKEWGQMYFANNCKHEETKSEEHSFYKH